MTSLLLAFLAAGSAAFLSAHAVRAIMRRMAPDPLADFLDVKQEAWSTKVGEKLADHLPTSRSTIEQMVSWVRRGGTDETPGKVAFRMAAFGIVGVILFAQNPSGAMLFAPFVLAALPYQQLKRNAEKVQEIAVRRLPELAVLLAAELQAGVPIEMALERTSGLPGPLAALIREAMQRSQATGRPLLAQHKGANGVLRDVMTETGLPALRAFGVQLDLVARIGIGAANRLREISNALASEYRQQLRVKIVQLDMRLTAAVSLFFFVPLFGVVGFGAFSSFLSAF